ncbi:MAG: ChaB family protein [Actinomycetota bacterium]|nr:ChaB family protein [Actinomycetota bacterium]
MPIDEEDLPGTLKRSPAKARRTYAATLESAEETYDDTARAHRTAWAAVKHSYEKVGDHWEPKDERGPSDPQAARGGRAAADDPRETFGGVNVNGNTKAELYERAKAAGIPNRSTMTKEELARAIARRGA